MINLLRAEYLKLIKNRPFVVCVFVAFAMSLLVVVSTSMLRDIYTPEMMEKMNQSFTADTSTKLFVDDLNGQLILSQIFTGNTLQMILAVFASIFVASEFSCGTIKNTVSKGYSRKKIYLSKLMIVSIATIVLCSVITILITAIASLMYGFGPVNPHLFTNILIFIGTQLLLNIAYVSIFVAIATIFRNMGVSIAINIGILMFVPFIFAGLNLILGHSSEISMYWLTYEIIEMSSLTFTSEAIIRSVMISIFYFVVSSAVGMYFLQKKDIS